MPTDIEQLRAHFGTLPLDYERFLTEKRKFVVLSGLMLYPVDVVIERNQTFEVQTHMPGFLAVGDDSGGRLFLLETKPESAVYYCDTGSLGACDPKWLASSFSAWECTLFELPREVESEDDWLDIYLVREPVGGMASLVQIKNELKCKLTTPELLKLSKNMPGCLVRSVSSFHARKICEKLNAKFNCLETRTHS